MAVLFIDCYDSFTYNLVNLIKAALPSQEVVVVHNDKVSKPQLVKLVQSVDAIVVGPGPGSPLNSSDAGIIRDLWSIAHNVPVLGVCFGMQSLVHEHGGKIDRLVEPQHGQHGYIKHNESQLFNGIPQNYKVIRYHSLHAIVDNSSDLQVLATCSTDNCIMAVQHSNFPFYAVQFHPESVHSEYGEQLISNFWKLAEKANIGREIVRTSEISGAGINLEPLVPSLESTRGGPVVSELDGTFDPMYICEYLRSQNRKFVLLNSRAPPGDWSIIGLIDDETVHIRSKGDSTFIGPLHCQNELTGDSWQHIAKYMSSKMVKGKYDLPFVGGLIGYITYEKACNQLCPSNSDSSFVFIENCILVRRDTGVAFAVGHVGEIHEVDATISPMPPFSIISPNENEYVEKVEKCKSYLQSGDSYELCLTDQTQVDFESHVDPWELYKRICTRNPAPYCTYMDFDDILAGSSPERFMSWDSNGKCQFRPIKGTVKKSPQVGLSEATEILRSKKEQGENLMIVDLIRHDLGQILDKVTCPQTMRIEEYETVYQLVSVIEGNLASQNKFTGIDVLCHALPPGSMTGAPKIRSTEILRGLEKQPRGLYSGVAGFWSIDDSGDWSVIIRSAFQYKEESTWRMGAGGAVTILSDNEAEYEEMRIKLQSAFQAFSN